MMGKKKTLRDHYEQQKYFKVLRRVGKGATEKTQGYIVDYSAHFVLVHEVSDFDLDGYAVYPIKSISEIIYTENDQYYDHIMKLEGITEQVVNKHKIDLTSWKTICESLYNLGLNIIVENEAPDDNTFDIGPITKVTKPAVHLRYFNAAGYLNKKPTKIRWRVITIIKFDDRYTNTFSRHLRERG